MAKKSSTAKHPVPRSFGGLIRGRSKPVRAIAQRLRELVNEELAGAEERFYGGRHPMAMYRTSADVCWLQPLTDRCNLYFMQGPNLTDEAQLLEGTSDRQRHIKVRTREAIEALPIRAWLTESLELIEQAAGEGPSFDSVLAQMRSICLALPNTKETLTWGKPHFRVGEKIFAGCGEDKGRARIGLKMGRRESSQMMRLPGIEKAPYSRPGDGWVSIDPALFDDWEEMERLLVESFRLIAPKRVSALLG